MKQNQTYIIEVIVSEKEEQRKADIKKAFLTFDRELLWRLGDVLRTYMIEKKGMLFSTCSPHIRVKSIKESEV